ncbi:PH domain-containing protein [Kitasatospora sp. NPDC089509]|uniref:PH domain-containing protein n=1 Tax=Kitasatospora sp. NPDC089509 TaxID=3364079 RepID=UPI00381F81BE
MNELIFRGKDRLSPDAGDIAVLLMLVTAEFLVGRLKFHWGPGPIVLLVGGTVLLFAAGRLVGMRYWVRVDAEGITVNWGLGRGRTYSWQQISWIDVAEISGRGRTTRVARIHTTDGRRHWLSALVASGFEPSDDFDAEVRQVIDRWRHCTEPSRRVRPEKRFQDRITPLWIGMAGTAVLAVVLFVTNVTL